MNQKSTKVKTKNLMLILLSFVLITSSCGFHTAYVSNVNNNSTNVELSKKNFKVVERVTGQSSATYILGIGGLANKALINKAEFSMLEKSNLIGASKAITSLTIESHNAIFYPFFFRKTITVSGYVIEFTE